MKKIASDRLTKTQIFALADMEPEYIHEMTEDLMLSHHIAVKSLEPEWFIPGLRDHKEELRDFKWRYPETWIDMLPQSQFTSLKSKNLPGLSIVEFNPTDLCNRQCWICPRHNPEIYPNNNEHLDLNIVKRVVDELAEHEYRGEIVFSGWGEPLLCPDIVEMIQYTTDKLPNCWSHLTTNGDRLIRQTIPGYGKFDIHTLIDAGLDTMFIDIYDDDYQFAELLKAIKPAIGKISFVLSRKYMMAQENIWLTRAGFYDPYTQQQGDKSVIYKSPCYSPLTKAFIDYDGTMRTCCHEWSRSLPVHANLAEDSFVDTWKNSSTLNELRDILIESRDSLEPCRYCDSNGNIKSTSGKIAATMYGGPKVTRNLSGSPRS